MDKEQLLEAYFAGTLSADQHRQLEWLLKHDADFSDSFNFEKETRDTIVYNERSKLKERFHKLERQAKPIRNLTPWLYVAASVLILCVAGWLIFKTQSAVTSEKMYAQYMEPYPNVISPKVRGEFAGDKLILQALALYDQKVYKEAAKLFEQIYNESPNDQIAFYLAICHLMLDNPKEAISLLEEGEWHDTSTPTSYVVNWYLGLAFLQKGDSKQALSHFKPVAASNDSLSDSAKKIVKELEKMKSKN